MRESDTVGQAGCCWVLPVLYLNYIILRRCYSLHYILQFNLHLISLFLLVAIYILKAYK